MEPPGGTTMESPWMGGTTFAAGEEKTVRFELAGGRCERGLRYKGGLFDSVVKRREP